MRKPLAVALLGAGKVAQSFIARLPDLPDLLGPVTSFSFRVASRTVNAIGAGRPVAELDEFDSCGIALICVPESMIGVALANLCDSAVNWRAKTVVLCEAWQDASVLRPLAARGALTASMNAVPGFAERLFVADGERGALRDIKRLVAGARARVIRLNSSSKLLYMAGLTVAGLSGHVAAASSECLRAAGLPVALTRPVVHALALDGVRSFVKAGKKGLGPPLSHSDRARMQQQWSALQHRHPQMARQYAALTSALLGAVNDGRADAAHASGNATVNPKTGTN